MPGVTTTLRRLIAPGGTSTQRKPPTGTRTKDSAGCATQSEPGREGRHCVIEFFEAILPQAQGWRPIITTDSLGNLKPTRWFHWPSEREESEEEGRSKQGGRGATCASLY